MLVLVPPRPIEEVPIDAIDLLKRLVSINSVNSAYPGGPGEAQCASEVLRFWQDHKVDCWTEEVLPGRANVLARLPGFRSDRRLILEAHLDTVSVQGMSIAPFEPVIADGKLFGRGACDTKGGLAAMMSAVAMVRDSGKLPPCEVWMAAVVDEEHSGTGIAKLCQSLRADAAIVAEPTSLRMVTACKGVLRWRMHSLGRAAHSSMVHLGRNAIHPMARLVVEIEEMHQRLAAVSHPLLGPATASVGTIVGGEQINLVPDRCTIAIDRRMLPGETPDRILDEYRSLARKIERDCPGAHLEIESPMLVDMGLDTDLNSPLVQTTAAVLTRFAGEASPMGAPFGSDASTLQRAGIASIVLGPGSIDQAHTADEHVELAQVRQAQEIYRAIIQEFMA
jgi:acetylornithine deacetylase